MALKREEWSLRVDYAIKLHQRGAIELREFPGAPGVWIVIKSHRPVGIACKKPGTRHPWTRNDRRIPVGSLLVSGWRCIRKPASREFFEELARVTGIPNVWIEMPGYQLLLCCLHVNDLAGLERMQIHIIDEEGGGYQGERARLAVAIEELEELNLTLPDRLKDPDRLALAHALAHTEALFERCFLAEKTALTEFAQALRQRIAKIYSRYQFAEDLLARVEAIRKRDDTIGRISPVFAARKRAAEEEVKRYQRLLKSALKMTEFYSAQLTDAGFSQSPTTVKSALTSVADNLEADIVCRPARTPARRASGWMRRASQYWKTRDNWGSREQMTRRALTEAAKYLKIAQKKLEHSPANN